ncbi:hypothetical protein [Actinoplanes sp. NPDC026670]|uniref:hypothetical protein n=1 Tax=Actinoplanes sp. NPDC026670 TaxID=3154700 RepID=UPI0033F887AB
MNDSTKRIIRTAFQSVLAVATVLLAIVPLILDAFKAALSAEQYAVLAGGAAAVVGVASAVARFMQSPTVVAFLDTYAPWLSTSVPVEDHIGDDIDPDATVIIEPVDELAGDEQRA